MAQMIVNLLFRRKGNYRSSDGVAHFLEHKMFEQENGKIV